MISESELRRRLEQIQRELELAKFAARNTKAELSIARADKLLQEILSEMSGGELAKKHSVLEWQGVGKEFWSKIDVEEYIRKERASWE